jgi:hypothetical protein
MKKDRIAIVSLPLTDEQRSFVRSVTGAEVKEALVAGYAGEERLTNEISTEDAEGFAKVLWDVNSGFLKSLENTPTIRDAFVDHMGHNLDSRTPFVAMLR